MEKDLMGSPSEESKEALQGGPERSGELKPRGGRGLPRRKKFFSPTIPQRKSKTEGETSNQDKERSAVGDSEKGQKKTRGRERIRKKYVQTEGRPLGEEAIASPGRKRTGTKPKIVKEVEEEKEEEEMEISFSDHFRKAKKPPVCLPHRKSKSEPKVPGDLGIKKTEPTFHGKDDDKPVLGAEGNGKAGVKDEKPKPEKPKPEKPGPSSFPDERKLYLVKFPSRLPIEVMSMGPSRGETSSEAAEGQDETVVKEQPGTPISECAEGILGKLQILESGKMKFVMGPHEYDMEEVADTSFAQEVIVLDEEKREITSLGNVQKNLVCIPRVKAPFDDEETKK